MADGHSNLSAPLLRDAGVVAFVCLPIDLMLSPGARRLASLLDPDYCLHSLDLSDNQIHANGCMHIGTPSLLGSRRAFAYFLTVFLIFGSGCVLATMMCGPSIHASCARRSDIRVSACLSRSDLGHSLCQCLSAGIVCSRRAPCGEHDVHSPQFETKQM